VARARLAEAERAIESGSFGKVTSLVVARDGRTLFERCFDGEDLRARRNTRSVTKTLAAMLVGIAIEDGSLENVRAPVLPFFGELGDLENPSSEKAALTIEDLLTMSSILECDDTNPYSRGNEERMYLVEDWFRFALDLPNRGFPSWAPRPADLPHGRSFSYCTAGVGLLGGILARATGADVETFAQERLFGPLGIEGVTWPRNPRGAVFLGGGLRLSPRELGRLGQLYLDRGAADGRQIISEAWVEASTRPHVRVDDDTEYGYLWWLRAFATESGTHRGYFMQGNGGNKVGVFPALRAVVVITAENFGARSAERLEDRLLRDHVLPALASGV
jgi:CubicO group peptidase (beta-lactamase class C family)